MLDDEFAIYDTLYAPLEDRFGPLDDMVYSAAVPFFSGGEVSLCERAEAGLFVTYDLVREATQTKSQEGLRYEIFTLSDLPVERIHPLLNALARHFFDTPLGDGSEVDMTAFEIDAPAYAQARVTHFSQCPEGFGLYEVTFLHPT